MNFDELKEACEKCRKCPLGNTKINSVFERGSREAKLMFVGEAPGEKEDLQGIPFVGPAGKLFDLYLEAADIEEEDFYLSNILKCRPPMNRDPLEEEQEACMEYLRMQVRLLKPRMIVCLGRIAAQKMMDQDFRITRDHGKWMQKGPFLMCAVYHPSAVLRDETKKEDMLADMFSIREKMRELHIKE